jgi:hypothetical protein
VLEPAQILTALVGRKDFPIEIAIDLLKKLEVPIDYDAAAIEQQREAQAVQAQRFSPESLIRPAAEKEVNKSIPTKGAVVAYKTV